MAIQSPKGSKTRPQYTTAICGACGRKKAYVNTTFLSSGTLFLVSCMGCKAAKMFHQYGIDGVPDLDVWPGSLELAANKLSPPKGEQE